jgi:acyl carrier protein
MASKATTQGESDQVDQVKVEISQIVQRALRDAGVNVEVTDDLSLVESGLLDSLSIISLVQLLQQRFDIHVSVSDVRVEVFDTVNALAPFVASRVGTG